MQPNTTLTGKKFLKVYTAILSQEDTNAPVATVLQNTIGSEPVWTRSAAGSYYATWTDPVLTVNKTIGGSITSMRGFVIGNPIDANAFQIQTYDTTDTASDYMLSETAISIYIYE